MVCAESVDKLTLIGEQFGSLMVQLECTLERWGNPTQTLQAGNTSMLPLHIGEGEAKSPRHLLCVN